MARYLLDSNAFLWAKEGSPKLRKEALAEIRKTENVVFVSVAGLWELTLKASRYKLASFAQIVAGGADALHAALRDSGFRLLEIDLTHVAQMYALPLHHGDPFDRLMIAQALAENLTLITSDRVFTRYAGLRVLAA
ncbi:MAG: type II toxin-antitoxin system VapC family toxin [Alphaproteobacteria bacterium]|mgnify:CR=1 FL=1|nr:type II toxin-antitoxin system VapC family toxin [Alphaproteobacteria bacterium]